MEKNTRYQIDKYYEEAPLIFGNINVIQIGRRFLKEKSSVGKHLHLQWIELTIVTNGECTAISNNVKTKLSKGDIYISSPYESHDIITEGGLEYDYLSFYYNDESDESTLLKELLVAKSLQRVFKDHRISFLVNNAIMEINSDDALFSNRLLIYIFKQIGIYTIRNLKQILPTRLSTSSSRIICLEIMNYIDFNLTTNFNLKDLSQVFNYNYSYLSNLFKKETKMTILEYYNNKRFELANRLLLDEKYSIVKISDMLGYSSPFAFSLAFKKHFGISPKFYKKDNTVKKDN